MQPQNLDWASAEKVKRKVRKRVLMACLDVAIMAQLSERRVLSAANIILILENRSNIQLSDGNIKRFPNRRKRLYVLTSKGEEIIKNMREDVGELNKIINELLG
jgi:predicted transcriptional regulator